MGLGDGCLRRGLGDGDRCELKSGVGQGADRCWVRDVGGIGKGEGREENDGKGNGWWSWQCKKVGKSEGS